MDRNKIIIKISGFIPDLNKKMISFLVFLMGAVVVSATVFRYMSAIPEPELPIGTPFGKLRFFDGVILYGFVILVLLAMISEILL